MENLTLRNYPRTRLITSRRYDHAPLPFSVLGDGGDAQVLEASEGSSDSEAGLDHDEEDEDGSAEMSVILPSSDNPLNSFALLNSSPGIMRNKKSGQGPLPRSRLALLPRIFRHQKRSGEFYGFGHYLL